MEENNNIEQKTEIVAADNLSLAENESVDAPTTSTNEVNTNSSEILSEEAVSEVSEPISSSKPQAVLEELDKLKTSSQESPSSSDSGDNTSINDETSSDNLSESNSINEEASAENVNNLSPINEDTSSENLSEGSSTKEIITQDNQAEFESEKTSPDNDKSISSKEYDSNLSKEYSSNESSFKRYFNVDFWKSFFFDILFLLFCVFFTFALVQKWFSSQEAKIIGTNQVHSSLESGEKTAIGNINVLVMGIDSVEGTHRSDTIFVLGVNPSKGKITMLSIPRDTRVIIENKARKINEILPRYGESTLRKILEDLLKINISRKVEVGFESFIEVVDAIGGVDINIEKAMNYDDNWGNLHIHFKPGMNHLDGQDALRYVRFRKDAMADLGRIKRQQDFVKAVIKKIMSPSSIVRLPNIIEKAFKHIKTDFTLQEILTLAKGFNTTDVKMRTMSVPGEARYVDKISYFMPYSEEAIAIGSNYFSDLAIFEIEKNYEADRIMPILSKSDRKNK